MCSTSGPLFIIGAVATGILGNPKLGLLLALAHYLSALTSGLIMRFYGKTKRNKSDIKIKANSGVSYANPLKDMLEYRKKDGRPIGVLMGDAVKNSMSLVLMIGGFIILFSVITAILKISGMLSLLSQAICLAFHFLHLDPNVVSGLLIGMLEMTNGINQCATLDIALVQKLMMISFMLGFGGLSINAQVLSVIAGTNLRFGLYTIVKLFQGTAAAAYAYLLFGMSGAQQVYNANDSLSVKYYVRYLNSSFISKLSDSTTLLLTVLAMALVLSFSLSTKKARA
jgi:sporulation integral membrane protein YlbJ